MDLGDGHREMDRRRYKLSVIKAQRHEENEGTFEVVKSWLKKHEPYHEGLLEDVKSWVRSTEEGVRMVPKQRGPSFLKKLYDMVDDPSTDSIVSWSQSGKSFIIWNESQFVRDVLPRCFEKIQDMAYFTHNLELIGFSKVGSEYSSDYFVRGQPDPIQSRPSVPYKMSPESKKGLEDSLGVLLTVSALEARRREQPEDLVDIMRNFVKRHEHIEGVRELFAPKRHADDCSNDEDASWRGLTVLQKLYLLVDDPSTDSVVSWSQSGKSFIIWNESEFCRNVLPRCITHNKDMSYFTDVLRYNGFTKVDSKRCEYSSSRFVRGQPLPSPSSEFTPAQSFRLRKAPKVDKSSVERMMN
uniref:Heat stress transcription factor A-4b n=1 Tax=Noccaea caerulescens TaxID=107243 RepID=A0A1J3K252_NOCCA